MSLSFHAKQLLLIGIIATCAIARPLPAQEIAVAASPEAPSSLESDADANATVNEKLRPTSAAQHGAREALEQRGVSFGFAYKLEGFTNVHGGLDARKRASLLGSVESSLSLDLAKLGLARGQVTVSAQNVHGRGINDLAVGAVQASSNLDAPRFSRLIEAWYGDSYFGNKLQLKAGRQYGDADFNGVENAGDFLNSSYGLIPTIPMPTYPEPELGVSLWYAPAQWISVGAGVYRGQKFDAVYGTAQPIRKGVFTVAEAKLQPLPKTSSQMTVVRFGVWQQNRGAWMSDASGAQAPVRNYGLYAAADYWFRKRSEENRGPGVFVQWGYAPADRNEVHSYWGAGIKHSGMLKMRPEDTVGIGVTQVRLASGTIETGLETFYKLQLTKKLMLQPDLQWMRKPAGSGRNALVAGLRVGLEF